MKAEAIVEGQKDEQEEMLVKTKQFQEELQEIESFEIEDEDDYQTASEILGEVKKIYAEVESRRKKVTDPLRTAIAEFSKWYKPAQETLTKMEFVLKGKIAEFIENQRIEAEKAMQETAEAAKAGDFDAAHEAAKGIVQEAKSKNVTVREVWDFRVVDLDKVPREFLNLDQSAVRIYLKKVKTSEPEPVPGLEFFKKSSVIARKR